MYKHCRIEAFNSKQESLGYLALPLRYAQGWVQLCYMVVYWLSIWKTWVEEIGKLLHSLNQQECMAEECTNNSSTKFQHYLVIWCLIVNKLLQHHMSKDGSGELQMFDKHLIHKQFNWLFVNIDMILKNQCLPLQLDPVSLDNDRKFCEYPISG